MHHFIFLCIKKWLSSLIFQILLNDLRYVLIEESEPSTFINSLVFVNSEESFKSSYFGIPISRINEAWLLSKKLKKKKSTWNILKIIIFQPLEIVIWRSVKSRRLDQGLLSETHETLFNFKKNKIRSKAKENTNL